MEGGGGDQIHQTVAGDLEKSMQRLVSTRQCFKSCTLCISFLHANAENLFFPYLVNNTSWENACGSESKQVWRIAL